MALQKYYHSSSFKMASLFTLLLGFSGLSLGYFLYDYNTQNFIRETQYVLDAELRHTLSIMQEKTLSQRSSYVSSLQPAAAKKNNNAQNNSAITHNENAIKFTHYDKNFTVLAGSPLPMDRAMQSLTAGILTVSYNTPEGYRPFAIKIHTFSDGSRLLIGRDIYELTRNRQVLNWSVAIITILILTVIGISFYISTFVVKQINTIASTAQKIIDTGDISQRIIVDNSWDDLSNLAHTLNILLHKIEQLMLGIRDVSDAIAHDLRTPLTHLRNQLETARTTPPDSETIQTMLQDADTLLSTFNALLRISKIEKSKRYTTLEKVNITLLLQDVIELYSPIAGLKDIQLEWLAPYKSNRPVYISADKDLLFQMFANLIDNAIKYSDNNNRVTINTALSKHSVRITIADKGIGIKPQDRTKVFDRFYRCDYSRTEQGNGLGLSLVWAIVQHHNATIEISDTFQTQPHGTTFTIDFNKV